MWLVQRSLFASADEKAKARENRQATGWPGVAVARAGTVTQAAIQFMAGSQERRWNSTCKNMLT